jgi:hypothetical protein
MHPVDMGLNDLFRGSVSVADRGCRINGGPTARSALPFLLILRKDLEKVYARRKRVNSLQLIADA